MAVATLKLVSATEADADRIALLIRTAFRGQVEELAIQEPEYPNYVGFETPAKVVRRIRAGDRTTLGFVRDELVGTVAARLDGANPERGEVLRLAVLPQHRGSDFGRELMDRAEQELRLLGAAVSEVSIVAQFVGLRSYYERLGYTVTETRSIAGLPFQVTYLEKRLQQGGGER